MFQSLTSDEAVNEALLILRALFPLNLRVKLLLEGN